MIASHAHLDHVGGFAYLKKISGAKMEMMDRDVSVLESGGKSDFFYGTHKDMVFPSVKVDRALHDGDTIQLDNITLTAHLTAGHTQGTTTFTTTISDSGKSYVVVSRRHQRQSWLSVGQKIFPTPASPATTAIPSRSSNLCIQTSG